MNKFLITLATLCLATGAHASEIEVQAREFAQTQLADWGQAPVVVAAIEAQNTAHAGYDAAQIDALDKDWRAEISASDQPTIAPVLNNPAADFLRQKVKSMQGRVTEAFVMDNRGLNVATSGVTSDYWQGDEAKFTETFPKGIGAVHVGDVEFDESTQTYQVQISFTIVDPASSTPIGAITVAVDAESL